MQLSDMRENFQIVDAHYALIIQSDNTEGFQVLDVEVAVGSPDKCHRYRGHPTVNLLDSALINQNVGSIHMQWCTATNHHITRCIATNRRRLRTATAQKFW